MKIKIFTFWILLCIILANVTVIAVNNPHITCLKAVCKQGESTTFVCNIDSNSGMAAWLIDVSFDNDNFDFKGAKAGEAFSNGTFMSSLKENGDVALMWYSTQDNKNNGEMFQLEFVAHDNAAIGTYPVTVVFSESNTVNEMGETIAITAGNGTINVETKNTNISAPGSTSSGKNKIKNETKNNSVLDSDEPKNAEPDIVSEKNDSFNDVGENEYYHDAVVWAVKNGVTIGTGEGTFSPDDICTRAQAVTFLWRTAGSPEPSLITSVFQDVKNEDYYYKAVMWALENGITEGTGNNTFSPYDTVTRAQIVTFMWRLAGVNLSGITNVFSDVKENEYYYKAVSWAVSRNITKGTDNGMFSPQSSCTRGQMVTFLYRYNNLNKQ